MPLWGTNDQPNNAPYFRNSKGELLRNQVGNTVFGVSNAEVTATTGANSVTHSGWVERTSYTDMHGNARVKSETLVAMGSMSADIGVILRIDIADGGSGYANDEALDFTGGAGSGAAGSITTDGNGVITTITLTSGGTGYTSAPTVSVDANTVGTGANLVAVTTQDDSIYPDA